MRINAYSTAIFNTPLSNRDGETFSSKITNRLEQLAKKERKSFHVENQGGPIETYHFDDMSARLIKRLIGGYVGEEGGRVGYFAERSDYQRFDWWRAALKDLPITFLEISVDQIVMEDPSIDPKLYFFPKDVIEYYQLNPNDDEDRQVACIQWIKDKVIDTLNPVLAPDFKVEFMEDRFRLIPLNTEVNLDDPTTHHQVMEIISSITEPLKSSYQLMSERLNKT